MIKEKYKFSFSQQKGNASFELKIIMLRISIMKSKREIMKGEKRETK